MAHSKEPRVYWSEEVLGEESKSRDIHAGLARTGQSGFSSESECIAIESAQSEMTEAHTELQESNYEGHLGDQHHTEFHIDGDSSTTTTQPGGAVSTFKDESSSPSSEEPTMQSTKDEKGVSGIANMRNTCYMNSALQALRHNTEISAFFLENRHTQWVDRKPNSPKVELVKAYADLLRSLWSASRPAYVRPTGFIQSMIPAAVAAGFDQFQIPVQHDSHEFLTFLMDQLHEGMAEEVNIEINRPPPVTPQDKAIQRALEAWKRYFGKQYSPFTEMCYGLLRITMTCETCKNQSDTWETFNCLKLPVSSDKSTHQTLESMLKDEFAEESIEGYACERCSPIRTTAKRKMHIWRLPRMVALVLKRFTMDGRKIYTDFKMDSSEPLIFKSYFSADSPEPSSTQAYECFATVDHHGSSGGGHYTAQAKSPLTEKWHTFDDETATPIQEPHFGVSTYIVFLKPSSKAASA
jgi:ubiquitin carboxyl-terminal hydrolase 8